MAIALTNKVSNFSNVGATSYATASWTPSANRLYLATFASRTAITANPNQPTATGNGLTWVVIASVAYDDTSSSRRRVTLFRAMGASPSAGAMTFDEAGQSQTSGDWIIDECTGMDTTGTNGSGAIAQSATNLDDTGTVTALTVTLGAFSSSSNGTYGSFGHDGVTQTAGSGFTQLANPIDAVSNSCGTEWRSDNSTTVNITTSAIGEIGGIAIEIAVPGGAASTKKLAALGVG